MIPEIEFKNNLINKLNHINKGWRDGDLDIFDGKKVDVVNDDLKIAIEIKDDTQFKRILSSLPGEPVTNEIKVDKKNRQFKNHLKSANKKFLNYDNYQTLLLLRTEIVGCFSTIVDCVIDGPLPSVGMPSSFFLDHDKSTTEVGGFLFWDDKDCCYRINKNPNVNKNRIIEKKDLEKILGLQINQ